jgi:ubiquinone/menaquinone biosynthesis C-methylase UbiE
MKQKQRVSLSMWKEKQNNLIQWRNTSQIANSDMQKLFPTKIRLNEFMKKYFSLLGEKQQRVLDVGCGEGKRKNHFIGKDYLGIDPFVDSSKSLFPIIQAMGENMPFKNQIFDAVISVEVINHVLDPDVFLREIIRIIKTHGNLFIFVGTRERESVCGELSEKDVHLHKITRESFNMLKHCFKHIEITSSFNYLFVWGWNKL